ncbi:MAG: hypothetical protein IVW52_01230 [Acidimicrobiales bacterium]|nr:hypothetical protein [Acidimicrobiales bacterium]
MPKRTFWLVTGAVIGAGSSLWAERKVRSTVAQATAKLQPDALVAEVGRSARQVAGSAADRVRDAVSLGRDEMQRREEELWADLAAQGVEAVPPVTAPPVTAPPVVAASTAPHVPPGDRNPGAVGRSITRPIRRSKRAPARSAAGQDNEDGRS